MKKKKVPKTQVRVGYGKHAPKDGSIEKMKHDIVGSLHRGFARAHFSPSARLQRGAKAYANRKVARGLQRERIATSRGLTTKSRLYPRQVQRIDHPGSPSTFTRHLRVAMKNPRLSREPLPRNRFSAPKIRRRR